MNTYAIRRERAWGSRQEVQAGGGGREQPRRPATLESNMPILQIEHDVTDFETWKRAFESGWTLCAARHRGLRRYRVMRALDDPRHVRVELEFSGREPAESVRAALGELWSAGLAAPALVGRPRARVVEVVALRDC